MAEARLRTAIAAAATKERPGLHAELAALLTQEGRLEEALAALAEASAGARALALAADPGAAAKVLLQRGTVLEAQGDLDGALAAFEAGARPRLLRALAPAERLRLFERLGAVHFRRGRHEEARGAWERGLAQDVDPTENAARADLLGALGALETWRGRGERAEALQRQALRIRRALRDLGGASRSFAHLGHLALQRGDLRTARRRHAAGLALKRRGASPRAVAVALANLATVFHLAGDHDEARARLLEALALRGDDADSLGAAIARRQLAMVEMARGDLPAAARQMEAARALLDGAHGAYTLPFAAQEAELALRRGAHAEALTLAMRALALLERPEHAPGPELRRWESAALLALGRPAEALTKASAVRRCAEARGDRVLAAHVRVLEARAHHALGHELAARAALGTAAAEAVACGAAGLLLETERRRRAWERRRRSHLREA